MITWLKKNLQDICICYVRNWVGAIWIKESRESGRDWGRCICYPPNWEWESRPYLTRHDNPNSYQIRTGIWLLDFDPFKSSHWLSAVQRPEGAQGQWCNKVNHIKWSGSIVNTKQSEWWFCPFFVFHCSVTISNDLRDSGKQFLLSDSLLKRMRSSGSGSY